MVNEAQRQQYLEAIGIDSYMPRWLLPVAPEPRRCEAPQALKQISTEVERVAPEVLEPVDSLHVAEPLAAAPEASAESVGHKPESARVMPQPAVTPAIQLLDEAPAQSDSTAEPLEEEAAAEEVSFALGLWRISDDLLVVDSRQAELALPVDALLSNMLSALGYPRAPLPKLEVVRWPYGGNAFSDKSPQAARYMMEAMLGAKLEQQPVKYLLLLGAEACHYLLPDGVDGLAADAAASYEALQGRSVRLDAWNCSAIIAPSLVAMLQTPELKALTWGAIQPLRLS
jgi:hypothetical protein